MGTGYTVGGSTEGVIPKVMETIFQRVETLKQKADFQIRVSFIEVCLHLERSTVYASALFVQTGVRLLNPVVVYVLPESLRIIVCECLLDFEGRSSRLA